MPGPSSGQVENLSYGEDLMTQFQRGSCLFLLLSLFSGNRATAARQGELELVVVDSSTQKPIAVRIHLKNQLLLC